MVQKQYIARVTGVFPDDEVIFCLHSGDLCNSSESKNKNSCCCSIYYLSDLFA